MKKRSKILASLVLAGTMVLGLAGCGDSGSANGEMCIRDRIYCTVQKMSWPKSRIK